MNEQTQPNDEGMPLDQAAEVLGEMLKLAGFDVQVSARSEEGNLLLDVEGEDATAMLDRPGGVDAPVFLDALSQIVRRVAFRESTKAAPVIVDAAGYRQARVEKMQGVARRLSEKISGDMTAYVYGMNSVDRRTVHRQLSEGETITTSSEGNGIFRRLKIKAHT